MPDNPIRDSLPRTPIRGLASLLVRTMALFCVRNTALEDIHAGPAPVTRTGDYSDVTVVDAEGQRILWPEVGHFDDDAMRALMRDTSGRRLVPMSMAAGSLLSRLRGRPDGGPLTAPAGAAGEARQTPVEQPDR